MGRGGSFNQLVQLISQLRNVLRSTHNMFFAQVCGIFSWQPWPQTWNQVKMELQMESKMCPKASNQKGCGCRCCNVDETFHFDYWLVVTLITLYFWELPFLAQSLQHEWSDDQLENSRSLANTVLWAEVFAALWDTNISWFFGGVNPPKEKIHPTNLTRCVVLPESRRTLYPLSGGVWNLEDSKELQWTFQNSIAFLRCIPKIHERLGCEVGCCSFVERPEQLQNCSFYETSQGQQKWNPDGYCRQSSPDSVFPNTSLLLTSGPRMWNRLVDQRAAGQSQKYPPQRERLELWVFGATYL